MRTSLKWFAYIMARYEIIKLWERTGTSRNSKPNIMYYYTQRITITDEEFNSLNSMPSGALATRSGWTERGTLYKSILQWERVSNNPVYCYSYGGTNRPPTNLLANANLVDFINTDSYEFVAVPSGDLYIDIATDEDFTKLVAENVLNTQGGGTATAPAYMRYCLNTIRNPDTGYIRRGILVYRESTGDLYALHLNFGSPDGGGINYYQLGINGLDAPLTGTVKQYLLELEPYVPETDPYAPGGYSDTSPGNGTFDLTSDTIAVPNLPTLSATNAGLVTVYIPTGPQLNTFASLLFGRTFLDAFLNAVTTLFVDPLEAVIGLSIIPVAPSLDTAKQVTVAFIGLTTPDGPLMMQPAASQYVEVNCGTIHVDEYSGSALDYAPYSKFHIYLPYIGTRELSTDEIRNKDLKVVYHIDIVSGSCVALLEVDGSVLYQFAGNCATPIPINGRDFSRMVTAGIQLAAAFAGGSAGAGVGSVAAGNIKKPADYISTNSSFKTLVKTLDSEEGVMPTANKTAGTGIDAEHLVSATAGVVSGMKPHIQHASGIGGSAGMLGVQKPYLIAEIPRQSLAKDYNKFVGYPSNITSVLGELSGFTQIEMIHLKGIPCTETELSEIDKMLKSGVIL